MTAPAGRTAPFDIGPTSLREFAAGSPERASIVAARAAVRSASFDVPCIVCGREIRTGRIAPVKVPHDHRQHIGQVHRAGPTEVAAAIEAALTMSGSWGPLSWEERARRSFGRPTCSSMANDATV